MHKGLIELQLLGLSETDGTRIHIAQPSGCNPIASAILAEEAEVHPVMPEDRRALTGDRRAPGDGYLVIDAVHKRGGTAAFRLRPGDLRRHRSAGGDRGPVDRARRRHDDRRAGEARGGAGRFAPGDTVVALITGNGLKTLDEHPQKPWPAKIECELDPMLAALTELKGSEVAAADRAARAARAVAQPRRIRRPTAAIISSGALLAL